MNAAKNTASPMVAQAATVRTPAQLHVRRRTLLVNVLRIGIAVVILGGWELGARIELIDSFFFGKPSGIFLQILTWITDGTSRGPLWRMILVTMEETLLGFFIGAAGGIVLGVMLGRNRLLADIFGPYIQIANSIPRVVLGSIFIISLGLGLASKVALATVLVFFSVFANAFQGVREVDHNLVANARILGANPAQLFREVILPSALTWIIASLHISFGFALVGAVVGEFLGSLEGIGTLIATAQGAFNANGVFAAMIILAVLALVADWLITGLEHRLIVWRPNIASSQGL